MFCAQGKKRSSCGTIPLEELVSRLFRVRAGEQGLVLTGGEPTIHKQILKLVREARRMGFHPIQIQTNGRMLSYPGAVEALLAAGATEFAPSLHGSTAAIHDSLTRAAGSWAETVEGMRRCRRAGVPLVTNSVVTRANVTDLPMLVDLLGGIGVRHAQLAFVHPVGTAFEMFDDVVPRLPDVVEPLRRARDAARAHAMALFTEAVPYCFLRGMEELCVEEVIPHTTVIDLEGQVADYSAWRTSEGKAHGEPCAACSARSRCEGPWREYPERYGWSEFTPLS